MAESYMGWTLSSDHITNIITEAFQGITIRYGDTVSQDFRWLLFMYATKIKGIKYRDLGLSKPHGNMIKNRKRNITDTLFDKLLEKLSAKDLILVLETIREWEQGRARRLAWLGRRPHTAEARGSNPRGPTNNFVLAIVSSSLAS